MGAVQGIITSRDALLHPLLIVREYGVHILWRMLVCEACGRRTTFLEIIWTSL